MNIESSFIASLRQGKAFYINKRVCIYSVYYTFIQISTPYCFYIRLMLCVDLYFTIIEVISIGLPSLDSKLFVK